MFRLRAARLLQVLSRSLGSADLANVEGQLQGLLEQQRRRLHGVVRAAEEAGLGSFGNAAVALQAIPGPEVGRLLLFGQRPAQRAHALPVVGGKDEAPGCAGAAQTVEVL